MITVGMNYDVIEGKQQEFETVFAKVLDLMKDMKGHGQSHLYKHVFKPNSYLVISEWTDDAAFDGFIRSERFRNVADWGKKEILTGRPVHQVYGRGAQA